MDKKTDEKIVIIIWWMALAATILMTLLSFSSCTTTKYIEVPTVKTDTLYQSKTVTDSIYVHDSTIVKMTGDTVYVERWHTRWRDRIIRDTVYQSTADTVTLAYPVETVKEVERELSGWQQFRLHLANITLIVLALLAGVWVWRKFR